MVFEGAVYSRDCGLFFFPLPPPTTTWGGNPCSLTVGRVPNGETGKSQSRLTASSSQRGVGIIQQVGYPCFESMSIRHSSGVHLGSKERKGLPWPGSAPIPEPSLSAGVPGKRESQRRSSITATFRIAASAAASPVLALESIHRIEHCCPFLCLHHLHLPPILPAFFICRSQFLVLHPITLLCLSESELMHAPLCG